LNKIKSEIARIKERESDATRATREIDDYLQSEETKWNDADEKLSELSHKHTDQNIAYQMSVKAEASQQIADRISEMRDSLVWE